MAESSPGVAQSDSRPDRLESWKEIAAYLKRDITTVQRWEKREGMPVHRHQHDRMGSVYASRAELDQWWHSRNLRLAQPSQPEVSVPDIQINTPLAGPSVSHRNRAALFVVALLLVITALALLWRNTEYFWHNPLLNARFQPLAEFNGIEEAAAISRDGHFVAFLSDRDGQMDVWLTQLGSGQFHNLTHGGISELVNPSIRTLGFSPDASLVTFWCRRKSGATADNDINIWAVPTLGGQPRPYLEGVAEFDWSGDGSRLVYHTPGPGDPTFVSNGGPRRGDLPVLTAPEGIHSHFPLLSPDQRFIYFVQGAPNEKSDIWRIPVTGGKPERITSHNANVSYPVLLSPTTLVYLTTSPDGSGPWLYGLDVNRRVPHRLTSGPERYTSLSASADGRRIVATIANPKRTLWRFPLTLKAGDPSTASPIPITTSSGFAPRLGPGFLLYVSSNAGRESIWKIVEGSGTELWDGPGEIFGGPAISRDGEMIAFSVRQNQQTLLYLMLNDGSRVRVLNSSLRLQGDLAWSPDGQSIVSAAIEGDLPHLFRIPLDGRSPEVLVREYSSDPVWSPDARYLLYSGPDVGTNFVVKAVSATGDEIALPPLTLSRGARRLAFLPSGQQLLLLRGELSHKSLWLHDLKKGTEQRLTSFGPDFDINNFDVSPDGSEIVLERIQAHSDVVLIDLAPADGLIR